METDPTLQLLGNAMDAALMRQTAIANNIANIHTKNYKQMDVQFEEQLKGKDLTIAKTLTPFYQEKDSDVILDEQIAKNVMNGTQYKALLKGINYKLSIMRLALAGNHS